MNSEWKSTEELSAYTASFSEEFGESGVGVGSGAGRLPVAGKWEDLSFKLHPTALLFLDIGVDSHQGDHSL